MKKPTEFLFTMDKRQPIRGWLQTLTATTTPVQPEVLTKAKLSASEQDSDNKALLLEELDAYLIANPTEINATGIFDVTAMHAVAEINCLDTMRVLLNYQPNLSLLNVCGQTPKDRAACFGNQTMVELLESHLNNDSIDSEQAVKNKM